MKKARIKNNRCAIVFITELYLDYGGVETRCRQYVRFWKRRGWNAYIAATRPSVRGEEFLRGLRRCAFWNTCLLCWWRFTLKVRAVEWQSGGTGKIYFYPRILHLAGIRTGVVFHGQAAPRAGRMIEKIDYALCVSPVQKKRFPFLQSCDCVVNAVSVSVPCWKFSGQKKALLVSRCDKDKASSIYAFIHFCLKMGISFDVVGDGNFRFRAEKLARQLCKKKGLSAPRFFGKKPAEKFLREHASAYLFAAGIGLSALEAAAAGYPVLLVPLAGRNRCFFLKEENFSALQFCNFSPHTVAECLPFTQDISSVRTDLQKLLSGKSHFLSIPLSYLNDRSVEKVQAQYWESVWRVKK